MWSFSYFLIPFSIIFCGKNLRKNPPPAGISLPKNLVVSMGYSIIFPLGSSDSRNLLLILYGFFSAHAANTFAIASFFYFSFKTRSPYFFLLFFWASIVSYSRIYVGVHFPLDIIVGGIFGILTGLFFAYGINKINFS